MIRRPLALVSALVLAAACQAADESDPTPRATALIATGEPKSAVALLEPWVSAHPDDQLARQTLMAARVAALEAEIRGILQQQADTKGLLIGGPDYEMAKARAGRDIANRLDIAEAYLSDRRYTEAVGVCNAILRDHPHEPATLCLKYRVLEKMAEVERAELLRERTAQRETAMNDVIGKSVPPPDRPKLARTVWVFDEDIQEVERLKLREKMLKKVDLIYEQVSIREVLRPLFAQAGINYVILDSALSTETLTIEVRDETIENALSIIAKQVKLAYNYSGATVFVSPADSAVLTTEIIRLQSGLTDVVTDPQIGDSGGGGGGGGGAGAAPAAPGAPGAPPAAGGGGSGGGKSDLERFLDQVSQGQILVDWPAGSSLYLDRKSNTVFVRSSPGAIAEVKRLMAALDYNNAMIKMEARFVELSESAGRELGINWSTGGIVGVGKDQFIVSGNGVTPTRNADGSLNTPGTLGQIESSPLSIATDAAALAGGATGSGLLAQVYYNSKNLMNIRAQLAALEKDGKLDTLSAPTITSLNNQLGQINVEQTIPYVTDYEIRQQNSQLVTTGTGTTVSSQPAVLVPRYGDERTWIRLKIRPSVARNSDIITMHITPSVRELVTMRTTPFSYVAAQNQAPLTGTIEKPQFGERNLGATLHVKNGSTIILGGLTREVDQTNNAGVPFFNRLPLIGGLFKRTSKSTERRNLVIVVTATIMDPSGAEYGAEVRRLRDSVRAVTTVELKAADEERARQDAATDAAAAAQPKTTSPPPTTGSPWRRDGR